MAGMTEAEFSIGQQVRRAREARGLSRDQLALQSGTSVSTIARLELNGRLPKLRRFASIASALDLSLDDLLSDRTTTTRVAS